MNIYFDTNQNNKTNTKNNSLGKILKKTLSFLTFCYFKNPNPMNDIPKHQPNTPTYNLQVLSTS